MKLATAIILGVLIYRGDWLSSSMTWTGTFVLVIGAHYIEHLVKKSSKPQSAPTKPQP